MPVNYLFVPPEIAAAKIQSDSTETYPKSVCYWNNLPTDTIESQSLQVFLDKL